MRHKIDKDTIWVTVPYTTDNNVISYHEVGIGENQDYPDFHEFFKSRLRANKGSLRRLADELDMTEEDLLDNLLDGADGVPDIIKDMVIACYEGYTDKEIK